MRSRHPAKPDELGACPGICARDWQCPIGRGRDCLGNAGGGDWIHAGSVRAISSPMPAGTGPATSPVPARCPGRWRRNACPRGTGSMLIRSRASGLPESGPRRLPGLFCKATFPRGPEPVPKPLRQPGVPTAPRAPEFSPAWRPAVPTAHGRPEFHQPGGTGFHRPRRPRTGTSSKTTSDHERKEPC